MNTRQQPPAKRATWANRLAAVTTACALLAASVGCSTTKSVRITAAAPPAPESDARILGVTTTEGEALEFVEPARLVGIDAANPYLLGWTATTYLGQPADERNRIFLEDIETYDLLETRKSGPSTLGIIGVVAAAVVFGFGFAFCAGDNFMC